jgi:hypothetical protein
MAFQRPTFGACICLAKSLIALLMSGLDVLPDTSVYLHISASKVDDSSPFINMLSAGASVNKICPVQYLQIR